MFKKYKSLLKKKRKKTDLTQEEISKRCGISVRGYQNYEMGIRIPNAKVAKKLAKALGTTVEKLF